MTDRKSRIRVAVTGLVLLLVLPSLAREWTDNTGRYSVEAELVRVSGAKAYLRSPDGKTISVDLSRLSQADLDFIKSQLPSGLPSGQPGEPASSNNALKVALLVGINDYLSDSLSDLAGCVHDVHDMKDLLVGKFEFPEENVLVLTDAQATHDGIRNAFQQHLIDNPRLTEDAIVVFYFSGHGSQMKDVSGDETDRYDETLVPYDSRTPGVFDISDDQLHALLRQLSNQTKNVTYILDSCHADQRTQAAKSVPPDPREPPAESTRHRSTVRGMAGPESDDLDHAFLAGCLEFERSYEYYVNGRIRGTLTYFLTREIRASGASQVTYRDIMDQVKAKVTAVHGAQHPQLEGARMDQVVFGASTSLVQPHILASPKRGAVQLSAGRVLGLTVGSQFDVYLPGTKRFDDPQQAIARIQLTSIANYTAMGEIISGGPVSPSSRAVERVHSHEGRKFPVFIDVGGTSSDDAMPSAMLAGLRQRLSTVQPWSEYLATVEQARDGRILVFERSDGMVQVTSEGGTTMHSRPIPSHDSDATARVLNQIKHWAQWFNVLDLENQAASLPVKFRVSGPARQIDEESLEQVFHAADRITLHVQNTGRKRLFFAILDLASDGSREVIWPLEGGSEVLAPGMSWSHTMQVGVPNGQRAVTDYLKLLVFDQPVDVSYLRSDAAPRSASEQSVTFPLSKALLRSRGVRRIQSSSWGTKTRVLRVVAQ